MSYTIISVPPDYSSVNSQLLFVVNESVKAIDPVTYPNYKYICDVYNSGTLLARLKTFPYPDTGYGVFDISNIVRAYCNMQLNPDTNIRCQEFTTGEFRIDIICEFGEEYGTTLTTNIVEDSERSYFNHYNGRLVGSDITILENFTNKYATNRPLITNILNGAKYVFIPYFNTDSATYFIKLKSYDEAGNFISEGATTDSSHFYSIQQINLSLLLSFGYSGISYITLHDSDDNLLYTFNIIDECKYTPYTIHFLNKFGGFETYHFTKVSRKSFDIEKKSYTQQAWRLDNTGVIRYNEPRGGIVNYDSITTYSSNFKEKLKLNADITTDAEYRWLSDLVLSPIVYIEDKDFAGTTFLVPVSIVATNYDFKKVINDKITNLQIDIEYGRNFNTQFR